MIYISIILAIIVFEVVVKSSIENKNLYGIRLLKGHVELTALDNYGVLGGFFKKSTDDLRKILSIFLWALSFVYFLMLIFNKSMSRLGKLSLALILGGGFSNLLDRFRFGFVKDYFVFKKTRFKMIRNVVFNSADVFIFLGSFLYLLRKLAKGKL